MRIKILGPGCKNCDMLEQRTREALAELGVTAEIEKVTDYEQILAFGVMATPGLVVNNQVLVSGKVPTSSSIRDLLTQIS